MEISHSANAPCTTGAKIKASLIQSSAALAWFGVLRTLSPGKRNKAMTSYTKWLNGRPVIVQDAIKVKSSRILTTRSKVGTRHQKVFKYSFVNLVPDNTVMAKGGTFIMNSNTWEKINEQI